MRLDIRNLTLRYPKALSHVFSNLSLSLTDSGFNALFGPSGVGKTTLAKIISGQITRYSGEIIADGMQTFLYSYNLERLPGWSSVGKHIEKITPAGRDDRKKELIQAFGLEEIMGQRFSELSLGQKNRVNLLRYLLQDFDLLIMDESLANVDELTREKILLRIKEMFPDTHFLYISHNVVEVSKFCRSIVVLRDPGRTPQTCIVKGQDLLAGGEIVNENLERTMLEIVNASS